jgi:hypothetical protein
MRFSGALTARLVLVAGALWLAPGCTTIAADAVTSTTGAVSDAINQRDVKSHAVRSIKTISINRVAVMPLVAATPGVGETQAPGGPEANQIVSKKYINLTIK